MAAPDDSSPETTYDEPAAPAKARVDWVDIVGVVLLASVAVITAWCGFQSSQWGGQMSIAFSQAGAARVQAADAASTARDQRQLDLTVFAEWLTASDSGNQELTQFIEHRFPPSLATAFAAWDQKTETPFALPEYTVPGQQEAQDLSAKADALYAQGLENNQRGDNYTLLTVLFALVLFLTAMAGRRGPRYVRQTLLGLAVVIAVTGVVIMATFPINV